MLEQSSTSAAASEPLIFEEFFETGLEERASPFLTPQARKWSVNLPLKSAFLAAVLLLAAFILSWNSQFIPLSYAFLLFVYFFAGIPSLIESIEDLASFQINIDVLMTLAAFGSVIIGSPMEGALLLVLFAISGAMEDAVTAKAKNAISSLHKLSPTKAFVMEPDGLVIERALRDIQVGTEILIKAGEVVPLDGIVIKGVSSVNLVHLTGENLPQTKKTGDIVQAGAQNLEGALILKVTHTSSNSTLARIIELVTQAQESRPKLQRWFDSISKSYALAIICATALFATVLPLVSSLPFFGYEGSLYRSLAFLIAASPCALIIAIPIAYLSAVGSCASQGILLKGGITLDALGSCRTIALDKTGTLTTGELDCLSFEPLAPLPEKACAEALSLAFSMEQNAVHPMARAIVHFAKKQKIKPRPLISFEAVPGYGLAAEAMIEGKNVPLFLGNAEFILDKVQNSLKQRFKEKTDKIREKGELFSALIIQEEIFIFRFQDALRPQVESTLASLKKEGYKLLILSGDHNLSVKKIAQQAGVDHYYADLKPEDKLRIVSDYSKKENLAMIGDGINDAPALARATVGICMGKIGSGAAIEAADAVLLNDNIEKLDWLMRKAKATKRIVAENLTIATVAIFIASIPALFGLVPLWLAVLMHEGGTVLVGLNGLRLLKK